MIKVFNSNFVIFSVKNCTGNHINKIFEDVPHSTNLHQFYLFVYSFIREIIYIFGIFFVSQNSKIYNIENKNTIT